jgi:Polyketide cyclase / dehydrase and lipid transport
LRDHATWTSWTPFSSVAIEEPGLVDPEGEGAVRVTRLRGSTGKERIVSLLPDRQMTYSYLSGSMSPYMRDYVAVVDLSDADNGTDIHWHSTFTPKFIGSGFLPRIVLRRFLQRCVDGLAQKAAENETGAST